MFPISTSGTPRYGGRTPRGQGRRPSDTSAGDHSHTGISGFFGRGYEAVSSAFYLRGGIPETVANPHVDRTLLDFAPMRYGVYDAFGNEITEDGDLEQGLCLDPVSLSVFERGINLMNTSQHKVDQQLEEQQAKGVRFQSLIISQDDEMNRLWAIKFNHQKDLDKVCRDLDEATKVKVNYSNELEMINRKVKLLGTEKKSIKFALSNTFHPFADCELDFVRKILGLETVEAWNSQSISDLEKKATVMYWFGLGYNRRCPVNIIRTTRQSDEYGPNETLQTFRATLQGYCGFVAPDPTADGAAAQSLTPAKLLASLGDLETAGTTTEQWSTLLAELQKKAGKDMKTKRDAESELDAETKEDAHSELKAGGEAGGEAEQDGKAAKQGTEKTARSSPRRGVKKGKGQPSAGKKRPASNDVGHSSGDSDGGDIAAEDAELAAKKSRKG